MILSCKIGGVKKASFKNDHLKIKTLKIIAGLGFCFERSDLDPKHNTVQRIPKLIQSLYSTVLLYFSTGGLKLVSLQLLT